jgi:hypothetical protein
MKIKNILIVLFLASVVVVTGALFKIMHWPYAQILLITGLSLEAISVVLLIWKSRENKKANPTLGK